MSCTKAFIRFQLKSRIAGSKMEGPTKTLAQYIVESKFGDFPEAVVEKAKRCILDSLGCALGGYASEVGSRVANAMVAMGGRQDATILGRGVKVALPHAALANTYMANILDYDDTYTSHPGCTIIHPAVGGGEMIHASGRDVLTAVIVGYEVYTRIAQAIHYAPATIDKVSGVAHQTFGAVVSASKVLSLELDQVLDALGIAGATAPVQSNAKTGGSEEMPPTMKVGFYQCSLVGTTSVLLAKSGITGPHHILDGDTGFWRMIGADSCDFDRMAHGLSKEYEIMNVAFKPYSCCRWFHTALDAALSIVTEQKIQASNIRQINVETIGGKSDQVLGYMKNSRPGNIVAAEFSLPYAMSVALHGIKPGPEWFSAKTMNDRDILDLAAKIKCTFKAKSESDRKDYHKWPTTVEVVTKQGTYSKQVEYPKGAPKNMLTNEELDAKFMRLAQNALGEDAARELKRTVSRLEQVSDITELTSLLIPAQIAR